MKRYLKILLNPRIVLLTLLGMVAAVLILCECEDIKVFLCVKAAGFALAWLCYALGKRWSGKMEELNVFTEDL